MAWRIVGEYFENCSCDILCPCITSSMMAPADTERCLVPLICHIREGAYNGTALNGLNFIIVVDSPAIMSQGNWRVALYIDERATPEQRQALGEILSGKHGGVPEMLAGLIGEQLGVKFVPITYESHGRERRVRVPGILEFEVEGITVPNSESVMEITNVFHPMGTTLPIAKGRVGVFNDPDYQLKFDNAGKNGHYRDFTWQG
ncbi:MAG: DUF1326 domain-containing protein [Chloroflexi bacterium]|nr:DUF1326 domain-containing protein [Chloroflexota bacterium]